MLLSTHKQKEHFLFELQFLGLDYPKDFEVILMK
jgi:hypothetical protein